MMSFKNCIVVKLVSALFLMLSFSTNAAPLVEEPFPWPNLPSLTFAFGGVSAGSGTLEFQYSNINPSEFDELWWAPTILGAGLSGSADPMTSASLTNGVATYMGTTLWDSPDDGLNNPISILTRITVSIIGHDLVSVVPSEISSSVTLPEVYAIDVSSLTSFTALFTVEALDPPSQFYIPINDFNQPPQSIEPTKSSVGAMLFRSAEVPEPSSIAILSIGGIFWLMRRVRKAKS